MRISGQLFVREAGQAKDGSGRRLCIVAGIMAFPPGVPLQGETLYAVSGSGDGTTLQFHLDGSKDITQIGEDLGQNIGGLGVDGLLTSPIWRV